MAHLEEQLRTQYSQDEVDDFTVQPQVKDFHKKTPYERERAEENKFEEFQVLENAYRLHSGLYEDVTARGSERYTELLRSSPSFKEHSRCANLVQKGYDQSLKNREKYLREGVVCYAEALALAKAVEPWRFCVTKNFGDYDRCMEHFQRMESAVAKKMAQLTAATTEPHVAEIDHVCTQRLAALKLTPKKDFIGSLACITPKYCPALYRELADCYHANGGSTRACRTQAINVFACANDYTFRKNERFFLTVDGLKQAQLLHPSVPDFAQSRASASRKPL